MTKAEEFKEKISDNSWKDGELLDLATEMIENLETQINRWKTIASNLADEGQIRERISDDKIKSEIGLSDEEFDALFEL